MVRNLPGSPFHSLVALQDLARAGKLKFANPRAARRAQELDFDKKAIFEFILCLRTMHFYKRYPSQNCFNGRAQLNADGYKMNFDGKALVESIETGDPIFAKLAIHNFSTGNTVAVISFHLDGSQ